MVKYYTIRGGKPVIDNAFNVSNLKSITEHTVSVDELQSLKQALRLERELSKKAFDIHNRFSSHKSGEIKDLDAGIAHYIEEEFVEYQAETIRKLSGYHNDFITLLSEENCEKSKNGALACYMFDDYLQKQ